ncbi:uncharacterized protein KABA2_10S00242 [Maudiozyma barnettii]|uniref:Similar to Saccharomyces cerevisiae YOR246C Protein with similarity to oxidoreductases, found in lipid particles n=1 Tax=Maudiozyma barnettii TaxID=61262 RepID=A0A8H2ZK06_9SACH|nr:uncharacterized protein KABA2_10S00242 [Kazachstania barnettii]CAB4256488.1 similar to Saccharomyces cerevisiae YOR246C Protein with similarity to oxidoreductases, found in lipid particles [Kazachstania barnettii]
MKIPDITAPSTSKLYFLKEVYYGFRPNAPQFKPEHYPDLTGKTAIVTGCNTGIGKYVLGLLYQKNCRVIGVVRTKEKGEQAKNEIITANPDSKGTIDIVGGCDFLDFEKVNIAGKRIGELLDKPGSGPLNIVIHNAGLTWLVAPNSPKSSVQNYEAMYQTNVLGPQLLQHFIDPYLLKEDDVSLKRLVWVSSAAHFFTPEPYGIYWEDPGFKDTPSEQRPKGMNLYGQSKTYNIYQAQAWYDIHKEQADKIGCVSVSCYPGNLSTDMSRAWWPPFVTAAKLVVWDGVYGAYSELYCALSPTLTSKESGSYIVPFGEIHDPREDVKAGLTNGIATQIWEFCEDQISEYLP